MGIICTLFLLSVHQAMKEWGWELVTCWWPGGGGDSEHLLRQIQTLSVQPPRGHAVTLYSLLRAETKGEARRQTTRQNQLPHVAGGKANSGQNNLQPLPPREATSGVLNMHVTIMLSDFADPAHFNNVAHDMGALQSAVGRSRRGAHWPIFTDEDDQDASQKRYNTKYYLPFSSQSLDYQKKRKNQKIVL